MGVRNLSRALTFLAVVSSGIFGASQQNVTFPVTINVSDPTGAPIPNARLELSPLPSTAETMMRADEKGQLSLSLKPGGYCASLSSQGFVTQRGHISVQGAATFPIKLSAGGCTECLEVIPADGSHVVVFAAPYRQLILTKADMRAQRHISLKVRTDGGSREEYSGVLLADLMTNSRKRQDQTRTVFGPEMGWDTLSHRELEALKRL